LGHCIDGPEYRYSSTRKWLNAWKAEIGDDKPVKGIIDDDGNQKRVKAKLGGDVEVNDEILMGDGRAVVLSISKKVEGYKSGVHKLYLDTPTGPKEMLIHKGWKIATYPEQEAPPAKLTHYATTVRHEGFAEFSRQIAMDPDAAREKFPKCYKLWQAWGLVDG